MEERNIICIDLKSFFASVECVNRGLDPDTTPLVVTDITRGEGAITLAVTPYLKKMGVKSRGRIFELPKNIKIIYAKPRMKLYLEKSKEIVEIYLNYVSKDDMHIYSIDEVFLDVTDYLKLYKMTDYELALKIKEDIFNKTKIKSSAGIGPNLFMAKVAMDVESKHNENGIAKWTKEDIQTKLWNITPLDKVWSIGTKTMKKLNSLGIYKLGDINKYDINFYKKRFGILGEDLYLHANGIDFSKISEKEEIKNKSYGISQILYKDYNIETTKLIIKEMCSKIAKRLRENKKNCMLLSFGISYSRVIGGGFHHSKKLDSETDDEETLYKICISIYENYVEDLPIRKISIAVGKISDKLYKQLNLFEENEKQENNEKLIKGLDEIAKRFGDNAVLRASSLLDYSTIKKRNNTLAGHNKE